MVCWLLHFDYTAESEFDSQSCHAKNNTKSYSNLCFLKFSDKWDSIKPPPYETDSLRGGAQLKD